MGYNGRTIIDTDIAKNEIQLLQDGFSYKAISELTGTRIGSLKERNRLVYNIDIYESFRNRIKRDGIPQRLSVGDDFGYYFAGFFDGEGTIVCWHRRRNRSKSYPEFRLALQIMLREDDANVLEYIYNNIGGRLYSQKSRKNSTTNPSTKWCLENIKDLAEVMIPFFEKYPLRSKKRREYEIWKPLVIQRYIATLGGETQRGGPVSDTFEAEFITAVELIKATRKYTNGI